MELRLHPSALAGTQGHFVSHVQLERSNMTLVLARAKTARTSRLTLFTTK
jgi:hypothetical protein